MADLTTSRMSRNDSQARIVAALNGQAVIAGSMHGVLKDLAQRIGAFASSPQDNVLSPTLRTLFLAAEFTGYWGVGSMLNALHRLAYGIEVTPVLSIKREEYLDRVRTLAAGLNALGTHLGEVAAGQVSSYTPLQEHYVKVQRKIKPKLLDLPPEHLAMVSFMPVAPSIEVDVLWQPHPKASHDALVAALDSLAMAITQERLDGVAAANPYPSLSGFFEAAAAEMVVGKDSPLAAGMGREFERLLKLLRGGPPLVPPAPDPMALSSLMFVVAHSDSEHSGVQALCRRYKLRRGAGQRAVSMSDVARKFADAMVKAGEAYSQCASTRTPAPVETMAEQLLRESGVLSSSAVSALVSALRRHSTGWKANPDLEFETWAFGAALVLLLQEATAEWGQEQTQEDLAAVADVMAATGQIVSCETFTRKTRAAAIQSACGELLAEARQLKIDIEAAVRAAGEDTLSDGQADAIQRGAGTRLAGLLAVVAGLCDCLTLPWGAALSRELRRRAQTLNNWISARARAELFDGFMRVMAFVERLRPNSLIDIQDEELGGFAAGLDVKAPERDQPTAASCAMPREAAPTAVAPEVERPQAPTGEIDAAGLGLLAHGEQAEGSAENAAQVAQWAGAVPSAVEVAVPDDVLLGSEGDTEVIPQFESFEEVPADIVAEVPLPGQLGQAPELSQELPSVTGLPDGPAAGGDIAALATEDAAGSPGPTAQEAALDLAAGDVVSGGDFAGRAGEDAAWPPDPVARLTASGFDAVDAPHGEDHGGGPQELGDIGALMGGLLSEKQLAPAQRRGSGKLQMDAQSLYEALLAPARGQPNVLDTNDVELMSIMFEEASSFLDAIDATLALWRIGGVAAHQLRGTVGEIRRVVHSLKGVIRTCGLAGAGAVLHAMEDRLEVTADDGTDLASDVPAYLDAMAAVRATIELGREQFESGAIGPLPGTGGLPDGCDLEAVLAVPGFAQEVPEDVAPLAPQFDVIAVPDDVVPGTEDIGDMEGEPRVPVEGLISGEQVEFPEQPNAGSEQLPAPTAGAAAMGYEALLDRTQELLDELERAQAQPERVEPRAGDDSALLTAAPAPAPTVLAPAADSPGFDPAADFEVPVALPVEAIGAREPADAGAAPAAQAQEGSVPESTAAAGQPLVLIHEQKPEMLPPPAPALAVEPVHQAVVLAAAPVAVPEPPPGVILAGTGAAAMGSATARMSAPAPLALPMRPSRGEGSVRIPLRLANRVGDASGQLQAAGRRAQEDLDRTDRQMRELQENLVRMGGVIREIDILAAANLPASSSSPAVRGFDPLELDRYGALQEQVRRLVEVFDDMQASAKGLAEEVRRTQCTEEERAQVSDELQRDASELTLVDVGTQRVRLERTVAKACTDAGRASRLVIEPGCRVPGAALDKLMPVFEHLLRNAVAHGIEPSATREAAGKPASGTISIGAPRASANADGSVLRIAVRDDGRGIDHDRVLAIAVSRGLALQGMRYSREQIRNFLFMPGFSTACAVSELAGRGVGLDVVRAALTTLGGMVAIDSVDGHGTEFVLTLPTDSASMAVIPVSASGYRCLLPLSLVTRVVSLSSGENVAIDLAGARARVADREYPLITLASRVPVLDGAPARQGRGHLVLLSESQAVTAVLVDSVGQQRRVVVRQLGPIVRDVPGMVAGTALADGQVGLVINPLRLQEVAQQLRPTAAETATAAPQVLVVDDSATVRLVTSRFLKRLGYQAAAARDGVEALQMIDNGLAPDGVLLDLEMPGIDGFELLAQLRAQPRFAAVPMVVISSRIGAKYAERARELGATAYLAKPYEDATLQGLLSKLLVSRAKAHLFEPMLLSGALYPAGS